MSKMDKSLVPADLLLQIGAWRAPIFMVDRIADFKPGIKGHIVAVKHVTYNEPYISGHFPNNPVMPGVMIAEIFGQASEYMSLLNDFCTAYDAEMKLPVGKFDDVARALRTQDGVRIVLEQRKRIIGFLASQELKFRHVVYPGDTLFVESQLSFADANGFHHYEVEARVGRHVACSGRIVNFRNDVHKVIAKNSVNFTISEGVTA